MLYSTVRNFRTPFMLFLFAVLTLRGQPKPAGTVSGQVLFAGTPPKPRVVAVAQDRGALGILAVRGQERPDIIRKIQ